MRIHEELFQQYQQLIQRGELKSEEVPNRQQMARECGVSISTANRVHKLLLGADLIPSVPRKAIPIPQLDERAQARFWSHVALPDLNGCCIWDRPCSGGYGRFSYAQKFYAAHRVAWTLLVGSIPEGYEVDHVWERGCMSNACVNVQHLEPVTRVENLRRKWVAIRTEAALRATD